jgi:hypothetical protein
MCYGLYEGPHLIIFMYGVVLLRLRYLTLNADKLDCKTVSCHFIGYPEKSKSFHFYCPDKQTKFVEMRHAVFLEDEMMRGSTISRN